MELEDFIHKTLISIVNGTQKAINSIEEDNSSAAINPVENVNTKKTEIDFSIAVTVGELDSQASSKEGKLGIIKVINANFGLSKNSRVESRNESVSHIDFKVPIRLPHTQDKGVS